MRLLDPLLLVSETHLDDGEIRFDLLRWPGLECRAKAVRRDIGPKFLKQRPNQRSRAGHAPILA